MLTTLFPCANLVTNTILKEVIMHKEIRIPHNELKTLAENLAHVFFQRHDIYAQQLDDGRYISIKKPLETWQLISHLQGKLTLGTYVLNAESQARFIVFDADFQAMVTIGAAENFRLYPAGTVCHGDFGG